MEIKSLGQAGFIFTSSLNGLSICVDPYLSNCVERVENDPVGYKRLLPIAYNPQDLKLDVLVTTHFHRDHYDKDSVKLLAGSNTLVLAPEDCLEDLKEDGVDNYKIVKPFDEVDVRDNCKIKITNCDHGEGAPKAVGVIIELDNFRILEVGDTCLRLDRVNDDEYLKYGPIDVLIGPINGHYGNMNGEEFVQLVKAIKPKVAIPCHYGMFARHGGDVTKFYESCIKEDLPFHIMGYLESYIYEGN